MICSSILLSARNSAAVSPAGAYTTFMGRITVQGTYLYFAFNQQTKCEPYGFCCWKPESRVKAVLRQSSPQSGAGSAAVRKDAFLLLCRVVSLSHALPGDRAKQCNPLMPHHSTRSELFSTRSLSDIMQASDVREPLVTSLRLPVSSAEFLRCWSSGSVTSANRLPRPSSSALQLP